ncbi:MAG: hypothetical protein ACKOCT_02945, partial [Alphaproteobacteria bacterium]
MAAAAEGGLSVVEAARRDRLVVVTGLPRSGTSMAMRMLGAGGVPLVDDGRRAPSPSNPHGWFEDARVRRLREDASWLRGVVGSAVKIVLPLAAAIPTDLPCDFVWMRRPIAEVLESQRRMLRAAPPGNGAPATPARCEDAGADESDDEILARTFERILGEFAERRVEGWRILALEHADVLAAPARAADVLADFVGGRFD